MPSNPQPPRPLSHVLRALIEVAFIIFLFYSNLLMGEFNASNRPGKTLAVALHDIVTRGHVGLDPVVTSLTPSTDPDRAAVRDWDPTRYAAFAWKCGKKEQTLKILKRLKGQADALIFEDIAHESLDTAQKIAAPAEPPGPAPSGAALAVGTVRFLA